MPKLSLNTETAAMVVGIFGTTISPYLFFWQASQEVEDMNMSSSKPLLLEKKEKASEELRRIQWDTWSGMFYSNIAAYFIILATGVTLNVSGVHDISTAAQAAEALRPLAGNFAFLLFAIGLLAVGLIALPVLAGSAAYALSELFGWQSSLEDSVMRDKKFYLVIASSVLAALVIQYLPINPMKGLFWSAVINGIVAVPLMIVILVLSRKPSVMGEYVASTSMLAIGWTATAIMTIAAAVLFFV